MIREFQINGSNRRPLTNAERQQRWRDKHRGRKAKAIALPPPGSRAVPQAVETPAPALPDLPPALAVKVLFEAHVRALPPKQRWQLSRMIMDDLARSL